MNSNIFTSHISSTPIITRYISFSIVLIMILVYIKFVSPYALFYSPLFLKHYEFWRCFTCFLYFGKPSLDVIIHITFLYRYSKMLEEGFIYTADYLYLIIVIWFLLFGIANFFKISILSSAFSSTITYIWTRKNPHALVQIFGFISFPAFYLPFIVPMFTLITEKRILVEDVLGIVVGHLYFFFKDVYPKWGMDILRTPCFLKKLFNEHSDDCCIKKKEGRIINFSRNNTENITEANIKKEVQLCENIEAPKLEKQESFATENNGDNSEIIDKSQISSRIADLSEFSNLSHNNVTSVLNDEDSLEDISSIKHDTSQVQESIINNSMEDTSVGDKEVSPKEELINQSITEENINKFLDDKSKEDSYEEDGWSSETISDEESN